MRLPVLLLGALLVLPAKAATVEVLVRERQAEPIPDQTVNLQSLGVPGETSWDRSRTRWAVTGRDGKAVFASVPPGRYTVTLDRMVRPGLLNPSENPNDPPPQFTIGADKDKVSLEIEVWRGTLLSSEIIMDRAGTPRRAKLIVRSLDGGHDVEVPVDIRGRVDRLLLPGRYEMELSIPPGYLLVDIEWNGESLPGHVVRFDVREDTRKQNVSWYLSSPCLVTGTIADPGRNCPFRVIATLVQPRSWIQAATERGGSEFHVVPNQEVDEHDLCLYRLWLPDGEWIVQPDGDGIASSDPPSADVPIAPNETRSLDFHLTLQDGDDAATKGFPLTVYVTTPVGKPLAGAVVEVWPPESQPMTATPLQTARTEGFSGAARFRGLAAGDYRVVAGREDFLEATAKVSGYDPKKGPGSATVTLREGAKLHARALDEKDRPVRGVELSVTRLAPLPAMALANKTVAASKQSGSVLSDVTGFAEIPGLYSGDYRVEARMTGEQSATRFVFFKQAAAKNARSIEMSLREGERSDVELLVLPAASLTGTLACSDRGTMPPNVSFRVFAADAPMEGLWRDKDLSSGAALTHDSLVLRGDRADRIQLGPLFNGEYHLAARPGGQSYWSWASGELVPDVASVFPVTDTGAVDMGALEIECGPLIAVLPDVKSKEPLPDLRLGVVQATMRPAVEGKTQRAVSPDVEAHADRIFLRRLQEGKFQTKVTLEHPYLIPPSITLPEQVLQLTRGSFSEIHVLVDRIGGLVEVRGDAKAARLTPAEGDPVIHPVTEGKADFPGAIPGTYRVELCADPGCSTVTATWKSVAVTAARTTYLP